MSTGSIIKRLREQNNLTQNELAKLLEVSPSIIGMYEQDRRRPSFEMLEAIADYFNVSLDYLRCKDKSQRLPVTDNDIKFALFGGEEEITDEMYDEVKNFAEYVKQKYKNKKE